MKKAFSLIELIVVIAITAVLIAVALPNLLSARERARDAKRKEEMQQLKNALRMYYTDFQAYPIAATCNSKPNYISGCGLLHNTCCPCDGVTGFAVGDTCQTIYMKKLSDDLGVTIRYFRSNTNTDDFCLRALLENTADPDIASSQTRCSSACTEAGAACTGAYYCVCAD